MTINESLKRFREEFKLTQAQVAEAIGSMQQVYYKYEAGRSIPSAEVIVKIASAFDVSTDYLLGMSDTPRNPKINSADKELVETVIACNKALQKVLDKRGVH